MQEKRVNFQFSQNVENYKAGQVVTFLETEATQRTNKGQGSVTKEPVTVLPPVPNPSHPGTRNAQDSRETQNDAQDARDADAKAARDREAQNRR